MSSRFLRTTVGAVCAVVCMAAATRAEAPPSGSLGPGADPAAPFRPANFKAPDAATTARRLAAALAWQNETLVNAYDRIGYRDPKWNDAVHLGLTYIARESALDPTRPGDTNDQAWYWLRKASTLGCQDPLVDFLLAVLSRGDVSRRESADRIRTTALRLETSNYPAYRRGYGLVAAATALLESGRGMGQKDWTPVWAEICRLDDRALTLFNDVVKDAALPDEVVLNYMNELSDTWVEASRRDRRIAFDPIFGAVKAARGADAPVVALMRAWFYADYAWDARGNGPASSVKSEAWPLLNDRLDLAQAAVVDAVTAGSTSPAIPAVMTRICKGRGHEGDVADLEGWFRAGIAAEPGDLAFYTDKLAWITPRWYGSAAQELDFARSLQASHWNIRAPLLLYAVHNDLARDVAKPAEYYNQPDVCRDVLSVYEEFLKRYPEAGYDRGVYLRRLIACGKWSEAARQLTLLTPDRIRLGAFGGQAAFEETRRVALMHAQ